MLAPSLKDGSGERHETRSYGSDLRVRQAGEVAVVRISSEGEDDAVIGPRRRVHVLEYCCSNARTTSLRHVQYAQCSMLTGAARIHWIPFCGAFGADPSRRHARSAT